MRIAISGTHYSGKSTLVQDFLRQFPEYESFEEPYLILEESGHSFSNPPSIEDYEEQLECAFELIDKSMRNTLFDRSPIDFLAYAMVAAEDPHEFDVEAWASKIEGALSQIDLIIFLPIEHPDPITLPSSEDQDFRLNVNEKLEEIILEDSLGFMSDIEVLEISGCPRERMKKIQVFIEAALVQ